MSTVSSGTTSSVSSTVNGGVTGAVEGAVSTGRARRPAGLATAGYTVLLAMCAAVSLGWLAVGAAVAVATYVPGVATSVAAAADAGNLWAQGVRAAVPRSEPLGQAAVDYAFSAANVVLAVVLLVSAGRSWAIRLLAIAMIGSAGAFNLQAHAAAVTVEIATGLSIGRVHQVVLHGIACAAYILALLVFPTARRGARPGFGLARGALLTATVLTLLVVGFGTALLPHTVSCVLFFGFLVPLAGLAALAPRIRGGPTAELRTQARLLFSVLVAAFAVATALGLTTLMLWWQGEPALMLTDPTAHGKAEPTALLFWFARLAAVAIAVAALVAIRRTRLWTVERVFSRGLAGALMAVLIGSGFVVARVVAGAFIDTDTRGGAITVAILATTVVALAFLPLQARIEPFVDRLLYGTRPTPYSVLAGITAASRSAPGDAPDLARIAEAVGRGLGATACRLTVVRSGLRDRTYSWTEPGAAPSDDLVAVPVRQGEERIGTIAVDRGAVAGLQAQRDHLLEDVADSLGVVLQANRFGIELERQLRAALAHAADIAQSRRQAVAEMDSERRRIERDLHDGAQHHLVSLRLTLGLVEHQVSTGQFEQARDRLDQVTGQIATAEAVLAETATGVSSPMLAEHGLVRALQAELSGGHPPVTVDPDGVGPERRFPADIEAAVYFCCLESVNNARKHAQGAPVGVRLATSEGNLRFVVRDEGPGWDQTATSGSPGRGLRNVTARISAVGGRIAIRSAPGAGTTVEGSVPLPVAGGTEPEVPVPDTPHRSGDGRDPRALVVPAAEAPPIAGREPALLDQVRDAVRAAREFYHGTAAGLALRELAERLDAPLRVAVVGRAGAGTSTLVAALTGHDPTAMTLIDAPVPAGERPPGRRDPERADAFVVLLRHRHPEDVRLFEVLHAGGAVHRPAAAVGALGRADELGGAAPDALERAEQAAAECAAEPGVRRFCPVVVPVSALLAVAGATLRDDEYRLLARLGELDEEEIRRLTLSADRFTGTDTAPNGPDAAARRGLLDRLGLFGVRWSIGVVRDGRAPTTEALAKALVAHSGVPDLRELLDTRFVRRADAWKARSALLTLDALVRASPQAGNARPLQYRLERIRSGAHELTEIDLVDSLRAGEVGLTGDERRAAERLLGAVGAEPRTRLGLPGDAGPRQVAAAAAARLTHWQRQASHPVSPRGVRDAAATLVRTCEQLLARAAE